MLKPFHGKIDFLSSSDCLELLKNERFAHLAYHDRDEPYIVPVTYAFDDGYIYSHSRLGKKIEIMRKYPEICFQVEQIQDFFHWRSVIAWGKFEELTGTNAVSAMRFLIDKIAEKEGDHRLPPLEVDMTAQLQTEIMLRMKIEKISGRVEGTN
jgi:nitroimidazol reductase NimA-like FMN-containing flavoprotein (pyridoxamine 5'-phosphate oxidase superfamily)